MQIGEILNKLQKPKALSGGEWVACCPAHSDKNPSLNLKLSGDKILINCKAGCTTEAVCTALGLRLSDLFVDSSKKALAKPATEKIVATYDYKDETGNLLFQVVRFDPKSFRQRHKNGDGEWYWNLDNVRRIPYHLPEILQATTETIYIAEGEKDVDNLWATGYVATTTPGGANNWRAEYAQYFIGKRVCIIPDKDQAGYQYARNVATSLHGIAATIKTVILPGTSKDFTEWIDDGGMVADLPTLETDTSVLFETEKPLYQTDGDIFYWRKPLDNQAVTFQSEKITEERTGVHARITIKLNIDTLAWSYFNLEKDEDRTRLANAAHKQINNEASKKYPKEQLKLDLDKFCAGLWNYLLSIYQPEEMAGSEQLEPHIFLLKPYILEHGGTILFAPPGRGKSYTAMTFAVSVDAGVSKFWQVTQAKVLFINLERSRQSLVRRLTMVNKILGLSPTRPMLTLNARGKNLSDVIAVCRKAVRENHVGMIVLDSISRAGAGDLNENLSGNRIIDALSSICPTWLALGHTSRASEEHLFGSVMQDAGADICVQLSTQIKPDTTLGISLQITKQNDIGYNKQSIYAFEFNDDGLSNIRQAKPIEFPDIEDFGSADMLTVIKDWIMNQDSGDATASEVADALGYERTRVSRIFNSSSDFKETRRIKHSVYYGVLTKNVEP